MARTHTRITLLAAALSVAVSGPVAAARVDYVVDAGVEYDDNVRLTPVDEESQVILRTGLEFLVTQEGSVLQARLQGRADYRHYQDSAYASTLEGMMSGRLDWMIVPERLSFTVLDELELQAIDRFAADTPDNRQQVNVLALGPNVLFRLGDTLNGRLEARYIETNAEITDEFNSTRTGVALSLGKDLSPDSRLSANAHWQDIDFDDDLTARDHERTEAYLRYERGNADTSMTIDAGYARLEYQDGSSEDNPLLRAEFRKGLSARSSLELLLVDQFSDAADAAIAAASGETGGTGTIPGGVLVSDATITPSAYREQRVALAYVREGPRTMLRVSPYVQRLDYIDALVPEEEAAGVAASLDYRLAPTLSLASWVDAARVEYTPPGTRDRTWRSGIMLTKRWTPHWSWQLGWYHYRRDSGLLGERVNHNILHFGVAYGNRPR
jgi:hypothetical protein